MIAAGSRWKSQVCPAEVIVVRAGTEDCVPQCGGVDMVRLGEAALSLPAADGWAEGCRVGKRYRQEASGLELLCTKEGVGSLGAGGVRLAIVEAKKLPSSD